MSPARPSRRRAVYLLEAPLRRPRLLLVPTILVPLLAVTLALLLPPRYRAAVLPWREWAPESPDYLFFGLAGTLLGLTLGLVATLVAELRDRTVKGPEDLGDILPVPLLATLPEVRVRGRRD